MLVLSNLAGPIQHFRAAVLEAWSGKVTDELCVRKGFRGGPGWILMVPCSSLTLTMFGKETWLCSEVSLLVEFGIALSGKVKGQHATCGFYGGADGDAHLFWDCTFSSSD